MTVADDGPAAAELAKAVLPAARWSCRAAVTSSLTSWQMASEVRGAEALVGLLSELLILARGKECDLDSQHAGAVKKECGIADLW